MSKILITTSSFDLGNFHDVNALQDRGISIEKNLHGRRLTENEVADLISHDVIALLAGLEPLTEKVLSGAKSLRVIARCGTGLDNVDLDAAKKLGIDVFNTPDAPTQAVVELTIGHMINMLRGISITDSQLRAGNWSPIMGSLLSAKIVGLIGLGRIGASIAKLLAAFGSRVVAYDPKISQHPHAEMLPLTELLETVDIVSLHVPHNIETHHLLNDDSLSLMKPGSFVVNVSRGGLVDELALANALNSRHLAGAALDCFEDEPYRGSLLNLSNVFATAHMGSYARETRNLMEVEASQNLVSGLRKRGLL